MGKNYPFRKIPHHIGLILPILSFHFAPQKIANYFLIMFHSLFNSHFKVKQFQMVIHSVHSVGFHCFSLSSNAFFPCYCPVFLLRKINPLKSPNFRFCGPMTERPATLLMFLTVFLKPKQFLNTF